MDRTSAVRGFLAGLCVTFRTCCASSGLSLRLPARLALALAGISFGHGAEVGRSAPVCPSSPFSRRPAFASVCLGLNGDIEDEVVVHDELTGVSKLLHQFCSVILSILPCGPSTGY